MRTTQIISALLLLLDGLRAILASIEADGSEGDGDDSVVIERLCNLQSGNLRHGVAARLRLPKITSRWPWPLRRTTSRKRTRRQTPAAKRPGKRTAVSAAFNSAPDPGIEAKNEPVGRATLPHPAAEAPPEGAAKAPASAADSTLRVDVNLLNRMMNLVGELVLTRNQILQATSADAGFTMLSRRLDMVTADLREAVMKARMQPVSHVFSKFPRLVRDLAQQLGKRVRLEMEGQETELDKSLLEAIKDPLTHSVRNSIDHGIEEPYVREAAGKPAEGILKLRAYQDGSHVIVEVMDDGGGIRVEKVRDKAIERKLIYRREGRAVKRARTVAIDFSAGVFDGCGRDQCLRARGGHGRGAQQRREDRRQGGD